MSKVKIYDGVTIDMSTSKVLELGEVRHVDSSVALEWGFNVEWSFPDFTLWLLVWNSLEFLPVLGWVLVAVPEHEEGLILVEVVVDGKALLVLVNESEDLLLARVLELVFSLIDGFGELSEGNSLSNVKSVKTILV